MLVTCKDTIRKSNMLNPRISANSLISNRIYILSATGMLFSFTYFALCISNTPKETSQHTVCLLSCNSHLTLPSHHR
ncbi:hypothetical protein BDV10DRAFT_172418 [Aspergillus recurvatus]